MNRVAVIALFTLAVGSQAAEHGLFLDPNAASVATVLPALAPQSSPIPKALPASVKAVMRLRHESPKVDGVTRIDHGTGALIDGLILTARHVIEGKGRNYCEIQGQWVPCRVVAEDADIDIAILTPEHPVQPAEYPVVDGCHSSVKGTPIAVLPAKKISTLWMDIQGFHHGASGSPIIQNGKVIAVAVAMRSEIESNAVQIVPYALFAEIWEQARARTSVAATR